jgi:uncharacterized protein (DUF924 family)
MDDRIEPRDVLDFWFAAGEEKWFEKSDAFDAEIIERFKRHHEAAREGAYDDWQETGDGCLALIILLDQFSRNMYRGSAESFAADAKALAIAASVVEKGIDMELPQNVRVWIYLPYEHSELLADQDRCIELMQRCGDDDLMKWAHVHADVIRRFGRFPHRNAVLGRQSTAQETAFLEDGGFTA